jgi:hypothetical protein
MSDRRMIFAVAVAGALFLGGCAATSPLVAESTPMQEELGLAMELRPVGPQPFMLGAGDALGAELGRVYMVSRQSAEEGVRLASPDPGRAFQE